MVRKALSASLIALLSFTGGCSDDVKNVGEHRGSEPEPWQSERDISGTWDFRSSVSPFGTEVGGAVTINEQLFVVEYGRTLELPARWTLSYSALPQLWLGVRGLGEDEDYVLARDARDVPLGLIPADAGGTWNLNDSNGPARCSAAFAPDSFRGSCQDSDISGQLDAVRNRTLASAFGELGGEWVLAINGGQDGNCRARIEGYSLNALCIDTSSRFDGSLSFTAYAHEGGPIGQRSIADDVASGETSEGLEFVATRRRASLDPSGQDL